MIPEPQPKPCVGCGYCCMKAPCSVAVRIHGNGITECPELVWKDDKYRCRLAMLPGALGERYREEIGAGAGCCCSLNDWRKDVKKRDRSEANPPPVKQLSEIPIPSEMQSFLACLGKAWISRDAMWLVCNAWKKELMSDGLSQSEADAMSKLALNYMCQNKSSKVSDFIG